jgi:DNA-binding SARP family transcriptional activator
VGAQNQAAGLSGVGARFAEGVAAFIAGDAAGCARSLRAVPAHPDATATMAVGASFLGAVAGGLQGRPLAADVAARLREEAEAAGIRWLSRLIRAALMAEGRAGDETVDDLIGTCERGGDRWGIALITGVDGFRRLMGGDRGSGAVLARAAASFEHLGAAALQAVAESYAAVAELATGSAEAARVHAARARALGASLDVPVASALAALVLGGLGDEPKGREAARHLLGPFGTWEWHAALLSPPEQPPAEDAPEQPATSSAADPATSPPPMRIRCLGAYELEVHGRPVDEAAAKPMERALLHLLSIRAGTPVHRESLVGSLWPDADAEAGLHRLQVAVSSLRRLISGVGADGNELLVRAGDAYRLALPEGSYVDVTAFEQALTRAEGARAGADRESERRALDEAVNLYTGPLLPGDGPADWAVETRRWLVGRYTEATARLASLFLDDDEPRQTVRVARAGLAADRYRDDLWKLLIDGADRAGHHAEAEQARRDYEAILTDLGV